MIPVAIRITLVFVLFFCMHSLRHSFDLYHAGRRYWAVGYFVAFLMFSLIAVLLLFAPHVVS